MINHPTDLVAVTAEFVGTFMFLFFAFGGTNVANTSSVNGDPAARLLHGCLVRLVEQEWEKPNIEDEEEVFVVLPRYTLGFWFESQTSR